MTSCALRMSSSWAPFGGFHGKFSSLTLHGLLMHSLRALCGFFRLPLRARVWLLIGFVEHPVSEIRESHSATQLSRTRLCLAKSWAIIAQQASVPTTVWPFFCLSETSNDFKNLLHASMDTYVNTHYTHRLTIIGYFEAVAAYEAMLEATVRYINMWGSEIQQRAHVPKTVHFPKKMKSLP